MLKQRGEVVLWKLRVHAILSHMLANGVKLNTENFQGQTQMVVTTKVDVLQKELEL